MKWYSDLWSYQSVAMATHDSQAVGLEDMAKLTELNDGSILKNLNVRYEQDQIYVSLIQQK